MDSYFLTRRIHSLTGVVPVGLFLAYHLYGQLYLHSGAQQYNERINAFYDSPLAVWILIFLVYLPLFYHSLLGVKLSFDANVQPTYQYFGHLLYWLQRLSGIGVLLFIIGHLWNAKFAPGAGCFAECTADHYGHLAEGFANPETGLVTKAVYLLGILGATFHFSNGINTFCMTWGIALTPRAQERVRVFSIVVFLLLTLSGYYALAAIW
ncbi:MAG: succinate dehydrogenase [bacterium]|jgi:succinate dehydrogenase / fumarate reductase cytochrome b subunit